LHAQYDGELNAYFQLLDSYANAVANVSKEAKSTLLAAVEWPTWTPPRFASHGSHTYYEAGLFAQKLAFGYDQMASELTQAEKERIANAFWKNVIEPTLDEYWRYDRMPLAASNWMANSVGGALMAAVVTEGDISGWRDREGAALTKLAALYVRNLKALFPGDGSELEPIGYQHFAMEGFSWGAIALDALQIHPRELDRMFQSFWWPRYAMVRPEVILDGGDFDGGLRNFDGFAYSAEHAGLPELRAFYEQRSAEGLSLSRVFSDRGSAVMRSGWDPQATVISLRAGPWFNHEHHDQGSFQVAAFGDRIISEAGYANYYKDPNYPTYFTQAPGHNTVLIDEDAFSQADGGGRIVSHVFSPNVDYVEADLSGAYDNQVSAYTRRYLFLRPDVLIVADDLRAPQLHEFTWLLHPADGTLSSVSGKQVRIETASAAADVIGVESSWEMKTTPLPVSLFQDLNRAAIRDRYVLRLKSARAREARFTVGMQFRSRKAGVPGSFSTSTVPFGTGFRDSGSGWTVLFRSGSQPMQLPEFSSSAQVIAVRRREGELDVFVPAATSININGSTERLSPGENHVRVRNGKSL
jgi:hypothetical protein